MTRARPTITTAALAAAALGLAACGAPLPVSNGNGPVEPPAELVVLDPIAQGFSTPDPSYTPPGNRGNIQCTTVTQSASTGPVYEATQYGMERWRDFAADSPGVSSPGPDGPREVAAYVVDFCQGTPVATVLDAVNVFLSSRPGSTASSFGGADPAIDVGTPDGPDSILAGDAQIGQI
ncbi:hypothetical protein [Histidinibacterium aquaticum]|uniref:Lipoprotein n=1 Tax=Histidinibacterium aquaticum TaxID=2613962 RepID=A0A5J5GIE6_9RHOB|nr:hypothetical protein [Histidinibacterium aquaticum]KAA9007897.1 hypothetical protein F3S47_10250 [Histidinibacterium aquaticum]